MNVVDLYTIQIIDLKGSALASTPLLDAIMREAQENITDLLPQGYYAQIRRWDDNADEGTNPDE